jgi:hypothetical protein
MWGPLWVPLGLRCLLAGFLRGRSHRDNGLQGTALRFHSDVAVVLKHLFGDVSGDVHNGLIASTAFRKVGDERVPVVVPTAFHLGVIPNIVPCDSGILVWPSNGS